MTHVEVWVKGHRIAQFSWGKKNDYSGWDCLRSFLKTIDENACQLMFKFDEEE